MKRFILSLFILSFLLLFNPLKNTVLASNFTTDYNVTYQVGDNSKTKVILDVTLTNITVQYYASSYNMNVGFSNVENIQAYDPDGSITPKITKTAKGETIELTFNKKVVGLGDKLNFNLSFDTADVATSVGNVWEVNIPGLSNQSDFNSFNVKVIYPAFLGKPASIKPDNSNILNRINGNSISFGKSDLGTSGISIAFGQSQIYSFNLAYHLQNINLFPVETEIALPPETNYQDVEISQIDPKPKNVRIDKDGNWLAKYSLAPSQTIKVAVKGKAKLYLSPKNDSTGNESFSDYLKAEPYWEVNNPEIQTKAKELKTARAIYDYVVANLTYDFSRVTDNKTRRGALSVLDDPTSAVCLEFTDIFIALARAAGIPAREIDGFANTNNSQERPLSLVKDVLHAWPEYYDKDRGIWIMVDPTWGNTTNGIDYFNTLDFDHFAFVVKGEDSGYPVPAGGYKTAGDLTTKDVNVNLSSDFNSSYNLMTKILLPSEVLPGIPFNGKIIIENKGNSVSPNSSLKISDTLSRAQSSDIAISQIPPYGYIEIPVYFKATDFLTNKKDMVTIAVDKNLNQQAVLISPLAAGSQILGGVLIVIFIVLSVFTTRSRRLPFLRKKK